MSRLHHYTPRDAEGNSYGVEISYSFSPAQQEKGRTGPIEDSQPPYPAEVTINRVMAAEKDITDWLESVDINWGILEEKIINQHSDE